MSVFSILVSGRRSIGGHSCVELLVGLRVCLLALSVKLLLLRRVTVVSRLFCTSESLGGAVEKRGG
jgi:hypothetical protein